MVAWNAVQCKGILRRANNPPVLPISVPLEKQFTTSDIAAHFFFNQNAFPQYRNEVVAAFEPLCTLVFCFVKPFIQSLHFYEILLTVENLPIRNISIFYAKVCSFLRQTLVYVFSYVGGFFSKIQLNQVFTRAPYMPAGIFFLSFQN